ACPIAQAGVVPGRNRATGKRRPVVDKDTTYVALDDSKRKIVAGILRPSDTQPELREIANDARQIRRLFERLKREGPVAACYEAGVSGYDLHRQITGLGVASAVIAPATPARGPGQRIKTARRDAAQLVRLFRAGELTAIHVLDESEEAVRDLVRCRDDIRRDVLRWRHRVLKLLARHGRACLTGTNWSQAHWRWIREQRFDLPPLQRAFEATLFALEQALARQAELDKELEAVAATASYREPVGWLRCFRGIDTLSAIILLAEVVDFQRFRRPRELMAYLGLVPSEYSSGESPRPRALAKAGAQPRNHRGRGERSKGLMAPRFPSDVGHGAMRARLESPRVRYATPGFLAGTTRAPRRRQLPTKRCHAALLFGVIRAYQPDSSSKPLHRQPCVGVLGKSFRDRKSVV